MPLKIGDKVDLGTNREMKLYQYDVVCLGILVADIFCPPLPKLPQAGEILSVDDFFLQTGGCAANTGIDLAKWGVQVGMIGKVGDDLFGRFIIDDMERKGLDVRGVRISEYLPTSKTVIIVVRSEDRRYIHTSGANAGLEYEDVDLEMLSRSKILYVGGYLALPRLDQNSLISILRYAKEKGLTTVLDIVVPKEKKHASFDKLKDALSYVDIFMPNDDEAKALTNEPDPARQAEAFLEQGVKTVIITLGSKGAFLKNKEEVLSVPAFKIEVVDPSGAGDAFDAGFILGMLKGWSSSKALEFASAIGGSACRRLGCAQGVFTLAEAIAFLERNKRRE